MIQSSWLLGHKKNAIRSYCWKVHLRSIRLLILPVCCIAAMFSQLFYSTLYFIKTMNNVGCSWCCNIANMCAYLTKLFLLQICCIQYAVHIQIIIIVHISPIVRVNKYLVQSGYDNSDCVGIIIFCVKKNQPIIFKREKFKRNKTLI